MLLAGVGNVDARRSAPNFMVVDAKTTPAQVPAPRPAPPAPAPFGLVACE